MSNESPLPPQVEEDRIVAILSYLTLIGFIVALVMHSSKKTSIGSFHLRQVLGILISGIAAGMCSFILLFIPILGWLAIMAIYLLLLVVWVHGLIMAATGKKTPAPVIGAKIQELLSGTFN